MATTFSPDKGRLVVLQEHDLTAPERFYSGGAPSLLKFDQGFIKCSFCSVVKRYVRSHPQNNTSDKGSLAIGSRNANHKIQHAHCSEQKLLCNATSSLSTRCTLQRYTLSIMKQKSTINVHKAQAQNNSLEKKIKQGICNLNYHYGS